MINYAFINGGIVLFKDGESNTVMPDNHLYKRICDYIQNNDLEEAWGLINDECKYIDDSIRSSIHSESVYFDHKTKELFIDGKKQNSYIATRLVEFAAKGLPIEYILKFLERLESNPSSNSREALYKFLETKHMPINQDGCFLGYKSVRADFTDWHSGKFDNTVGKIVEVNRRDVDDNINRGCSHGLHVGNYDYANYFHSNNDRQLLLVKVDPADVVAVPSEDNTKLRTCKYEVMSLIKDELKSSLYSDDLDAIDDDYEYDWDEDEFWYD